MNKIKFIAFGSDHAGYIYKEFIKKKFYKNYNIIDFGSFSEKKVDYTDYIHPTASYINNKKNDNYLGIIFCGTGNGAAITANKYINIRAAILWNESIAILAKKHNNANIISIPSRFLKKNEVLNIINIFLEEKFEGGRHENRIKKIKNLY
ncbi:RpiB/LacA/LacB family sugar-phosphate isomerase [Candidatus Shikimatogenerans silvanidophilus]|uniref:RpiB/LacA/LacB family sugar-phosphate isomerase n=1 Tax=Candidatus Shikimatogenerans silvanidophilus TaxID=2782547 RepID=UPI001BA9C4F6|nr:RpiB/LacA/LacB family sugar-phosphate isomerase [Candidatus Shikimatogenerans silvanidophilus]